MFAGWGILPRYLNSPTWVIISDCSSYKQSCLRCDNSMDKFLIRGGNPLHGKIEIGGAKNSALPCLAATLLSPETVILHNVPYVKDLITQRRLLEDLGATVLTPELRTHKVNAKNVELFEAPYELVKTMRASVLA